MKIQIEHRYTGAVLYECDIDDAVEHRLSAAVQKAVAEEARLSGADLREYAR